MNYRRVLQGHLDKLDDAIAGAEADGETLVPCKRCGHWEVPKGMLCHDCLRGECSDAEEAESDAAREERMFRD